VEGRTKFVENIPDVFYIDVEKIAPEDVLEIAWSFIFGST